MSAYLDHGYRADCLVRESGLTHLDRKPRLDCVDRGTGSSGHRPDRVGPSQSWALAVLSQSWARVDRLSREFVRPVSIMGPTRLISVVILG